MRNLLSCSLILFFFSNCSCSGPLKTSNTASTLTISTNMTLGDIQPFPSFGIGSHLRVLVYTPLFLTNSKGELSPVLAKNIEWGSEKRQVLITLKQDLAESVKQSLKKLSGAISSLGFDTLESIEVLSPRKLLFRLKRYDRLFLFLLEQTFIMASSMKDLKEDPYTGQFLVVEQDQEKLLLERKEKLPNLINYIQIKVIPSHRRALRELVAANVDVLYYNNLGQYDVISDLPIVGEKEFYSNTVFFLFDNQWDPELADNLDWFNISKHFERNVLANFYGREFAQEALLPIPFNSPWFDSEIESNLNEIPGNDSSGRIQKKVRTLSFLQSQGKNERLARFLKRKLEGLGIIVKLQAIPQIQFREKVFIKKDFDLVLFPFNIKHAFADIYFFFHSPKGTRSSNFSGYKNSKVDYYLDQARYEPDFEKAKKLFSKAMVEMYKKPPGLFLFWTKMPIIYRKACTGFKFNATEFFPSLGEVRCQVKK